MFLNSTVVVPALGHFTGLRTVAWRRLLNYVCCLRDDMLETERDLSNNIFNFPSKIQLDHPVETNVHCGDGKDG